MRIGQVAALLGVSTRTIRHYHHMGVLPEPEREPNGYRTYALRDLVLLARARRLADLGMSLEEVADAITDDKGADLVEILRDLDRDLERQELSIREARGRLSKLRGRAELGQDVFDPPALSHYFDTMADLTASPSVELDRALMSLVPEEALAEMTALLAGPGGIPLAPAEAEDLYRQMDALSDAAGDDPRAAALAARIVAAIPADAKPELRRLTAAGGDPALDAMEAVLSAGQFAVVRHILRSLSEHT